MVVTTLPGNVMLRDSLDFFDCYFAFSMNLFAGTVNWKVGGVVQASLFNTGAVSGDVCAHFRVLRVSGVSARYYVQYNFPPGGHAAFGFTSTFAGDFSADQAIAGNISAYASGSISGANMMLNWTPAA